MSDKLICVYRAILKDVKQQEFINEQTGKVYPYQRVELHNPATLENETFTASAELAIPMELMTFVQAEITFTKHFDREIRRSIWKPRLTAIKAE